jgi:hypothetical protein
MLVIRTKFRHAVSRLGRTLTLLKVHLIGWIALLLCLTATPIILYVRYTKLVESPSFGLATKVLAAIAAGGFGLLGVGKDTRIAGKLTPTGWIALVGIVVAAEFALAATLSDYSASKTKDEQELKRSDKLLSSVERGTYPFRGIRANITIPLVREFYGLEAYKTTLREAYRPDMPPGHKGTFADPIPLIDTTGWHPVPSRSPLFPRKQSSVYNLINNLSLHVILFKGGQDPLHGKTRTYKYAGHIVIGWSPKAYEHEWLAYNSKTDALVFHVDGLRISNDVLNEANTYSLVDFVPGAIAVGLSFEDIDDPLCKAFHLAGNLHCIDQLNAFVGKLVPDDVNFRFDYPKTIDIVNVNAVHCPSPDDNFVVLPLLTDVGSTDTFAASSNGKANETEGPRICAAFADRASNVPRPSLAGTGTF